MTGRNVGYSLIQSDFNYVPRWMSYLQRAKAAGSRVLVGMLRDDAIDISRVKLGRLMSELGLICKKLGTHAYKQATVEQPDIPNVLNREFERCRANQVWCEDITFAWIGHRWHYLVAVLDLYTRRVVAWAISVRPDVELGRQSTGYGS